MAVQPRIQYPDHATLRAATEQHIEGILGNLAELGAAETERTALAAGAQSPLLARALEDDVSYGLAERSRKLTRELEEAQRFLDASCVPTHGLTDCEMRCGWTAMPGCYLCDR